MKLIQQSFQVSSALAGIRLDHALQQLLPDFSRSKIQQWIQQGFVSLNAETCKAKQKVFSGDTIDLDVPEQTQTADRPQAVAFRILYQDDDIFVVDKPAGLVVHPAAGHADGTLVNGLIAQDAGLAQLPRAGIVHRLDKDTTGAMLVARNLASHNRLVAALQARQIQREYLAVARGVITAGRSIETGIGRHPKMRQKMAVREDGKPAITHFDVRQRFAHHSLIRVKLETGRTHQIRVHLAHINHPLLGDPVYGGRTQVPAGLAAQLIDHLRGFNRQALHAERIAFQHPRSQEAVEFHTPLPPDLQALLAALQQYD